MLGVYVGLTRGKLIFLPPGDTIDMYRARTQRATCGLPTVRLAHENSALFCRVDLPKDWFIRGSTGIPRRTNRRDEDPSTFAWWQVGGQRRAIGWRDPSADHIDVVCGDTGDWRVRSLGSHWINPVYFDLGSTHRPDGRSECLVEFSKRGLRMSRFWAIERVGAVQRWARHNGWTTDRQLPQWFDWVENHFDFTLWATSPHGPPIYSEIIDDWIFIGEIQCEWTGLYQVEIFDGP